MKKLISLFILFSTLLTVNLFASKNLYLSFSKIPKNIYANQKFEIKVEALVTTSNFTDLKTEFFEMEDIDIINPNSPWKKISNNKYENSYYLQVLSPNFKLPIINISLLNYNEVIDNDILELSSINYLEIGKSDKRFTNIIADDLVIKAYKTKQYNNKDALTIVDIDAKNSNLGNFHLNEIEEQGISSIKEIENIENLVYYFVTPIYQKNLIFTYFNSKNNSFVEMKVPLILQNELVSTQTDLNPNDSTFEKYKKIAAIVVFVIFFLLFIWKRRNKIIFTLMFISLIFAIIYNFPNQKGYVSEDSFIYILPTKNSTIFFKTTNKERVEVLEKKGQFKKVLGLDNSFIGWIKEESFEKN
ncbi:hypothetical protein [Aliarcobacter skirrowii]|uniref:SH3 domain-containing protein n=1 Tax=Aliarcobacter skirrowii TaxID=28200 RepID=A0AAW9DB33_9BACT|nr:hypothetical protein [Aliarcobacter skirrowii]MDX4069473.1 hypothetical protein [Aliarcobacter skirrowii]